MQNNLKFLIGILIVLAGISFYVLQDDVSKNSNERALLIPELQEQVNDVDEVIISKNDKIISLSKESGSWRIAEANGFLADANMVATLLLDLRKFKLKDKKTSNPANYKSLSLAETGENAATKIILKNSGKQFADISIGKQAQSSQGTYVRRNSDVQTWLAEGLLSVKLDSNDWIVTNILDIDNGQIKSVTFSPEASEQGFTINKLTPNDEAFVLENIPQGMQVKADAGINDFANGLQKFTIDSATKKLETKNTIILSVVYQLFSGIQYNLNIFQGAEQYLLHIDLENADSASEFDKQLTNWAYVIPQYKFDALNKKLSDLIETIPVATTEKKD